MGLFFVNLSLCLVNLAMFLHGGEFLNLLCALMCGACAALSFPGDKR
jgi:hypothetical protein